MDMIRKAFYVCMIITVALLIFRLDYYLMDYDEGDLYLYPSMLVNHFGLHPYVDFTYTQPPLLLYVFRDVFFGRLFSVLCAIILLGVVFYLGRKFGVGYYASMFVAVCPLIIVFGRLAVGDIPMLAMLVVTLYIIVADYKSSLSMAILGLFMFLSFMSKIQVIVPFGIILFYLLIVRREIDYIKAIALCMALIIVAEYVFPGMISSIIFDNKPNVDIKRSVVYAITAIVNFVVKANMLVAFSLFGIYKSINRRERKFSLLFVLILSGVVTAILYSWINYRHFMYLIPGLAVFAGIGLKSLKSKEFAVCILLLSVFVSLTYWNKTTIYDTYTRDLGVMITKSVSIGDKIYSDQPMLAFVSNTEMSNTASLWNGMGRLRNLTVEQVENDIDRTNPVMVIIVISTPENMEQPRIVSTFGQSGADNLINYLDKRYPKKDYYRRDYELMRIWKYA
jgi:hypothetical protein